MGRLELAGVAGEQSKPAGRPAAFTIPKHEREREGYFGERKWASYMRSVARTVTRVNVMILNLLCLSAVGCGTWIRMYRNLRVQNTYT